MSAQKEPEPISYQIDGRAIRGLAWGAPDAPLMIAVHGWLDNAQSFYQLAPRLTSYRVIAFDLAGHGRSDWRTPDSDYGILNYVRDLNGLVSYFAGENERPLALLGHSLGAGICSLFSATYPERVSELTLIENLGPLAASSETQFIEALRTEKSSLLQRSERNKSKPLAIWVRSRMRSRFPVPLEAAQRLMERNTAPDELDRVRLTIDPRLFAPTIRLTETQVRVALSELQVPVTLILGGTSVDPELTQARAACVKKIRQFELSGGHHLHLWPEGAERIARLMLRLD